MRCQARALRAERLFGHLHEHLLPFPQQVLDLRLLARALRAFFLLLLGLLVGIELLELLVHDVRHVQEAVPLEADVDEGRLHAGQDLRDAALVDVADDPALPLPLDEDLADEIVLEDRDACLVVVGADDHLLVHRGHSGRRRGAADQAAARPRHAASRFTAAAASIREPAHPHVEDQAEARQRGDERRAAITHERQRQPLHGGQSG